MLLSEAVKN